MVLIIANISTMLLAMPGTVLRTLHGLLHLISHVIEEVRIP